MFLSASGPHLRVRGVAATVPNAAMSRVSKCLHLSSSSILTPTSEMTVQTLLRLARRRAQAYAYNSMASVPIIAVSKMQGQQAKVNATAAPVGIPSTSSKSSAESTSSLTSISSSTTSNRPKIRITSGPTTEAKFSLAVNDLSDKTYTERAKLLLSKRSLIEEAARVDHETAAASSSTPSSSSASVFKVPTEEITLMIRERIPKGQEEEPDEKAKNSLTHQAGRAIRDKKLCGVVVSAGKMDRTVTVRFPRRDWSRRVKRHYTKPFDRLVHDPANAVRLGDVVSITLPPQGANQFLTKNIFHVVDKIVVPFGVPLDKRPPVMSMVDLAIKWAAKIEARLERRMRRRKEKEEVTMHRESKTEELEGGEDEEWEPED